MEDDEKKEAIDPKRERLLKAYRTYVETPKMHTFERNVNWCAYVDARDDLPHGTTFRQSGIKEEFH